MKTFRTAAAAAAIACSALTGAYAGDGAGTYDALKPLAGYWVGKVTTDYPEAGFDGVNLQVRIRVTASGHAIIHEMGSAAAGAGPEQMGDITVFYLEDGKALGVHYCDADTRSYLKAAAASDPNTQTFDLVGVSGPTQIGYVSGISFKPVAPDHHIEVVTFVFTNKKVMHATFDLKKSKP